MVFLPLLCLAVLQAVVARPDGLPWPDACESMSPGNGVPPQTGPMPFILHVDDYEIYCDGCLQITLKGEGDPYPTEEFAGYMVQVRNSSGFALGYFREADDVKLATCFGGKDNTAITINYLPKEEVVMRWFPDPGYKGVVEVYATIAKDYMEQIYWLKVKSKPIKIRISEDWKTLERFKKMEIEDAKAKKG